MILHILISTVIILFLAGVLLHITGLILSVLTSLILADFLVNIGTVLVALGLLGGIILLYVFLFYLVWSW